MTLCEASGLVPHRLLPVVFVPDIGPPEGRNPEALRKSEQLARRADAGVHGHNIRGEHVKWAMVERLRRTQSDVVGTVLPTELPRKRVRSQVVMYLATCEVDLEGAIDFARQTAGPDGAGSVAGALIGASTGATPWTDLQFAKHEHAWQIEVLVRDLFVVALKDLFVVALTADQPLMEMAVRYPGWRRVGQTGTDRSSGCVGQ